MIKKIRQWWQELWQDWTCPWADPIHVDMGVAQCKGQPSRCKDCEVRLDSIKLKKKRFEVTIDVMIEESKKPPTEKEIDEIARRHDKRTRYKCIKCGGIFIADQFEIPEHSKCSFCGYSNGIEELLPEETP